MQLRKVEPRDWLLNEFSNRKLKNPKYSLRAFAKTLGVSPSRLSDIFNQKRKITYKQAEQFTERLLLSFELKKSILANFEKSSDKNKEVASNTYQRISNDVFHLLREWQHFAILNLMETKNFRADASWIAKRLGLNRLDVKISLERLERCGLIIKKDGSLVPTHKNISTSDQSVNHALRLAHKDSLEQAIAALEDIDIKWRDISSMVIPVNMKHIDEAKKMIKGFRRKLAKFLEGGDKTEVYNLNIQLVPITKVGIENDS